MFIPAGSFAIAWATEAPDNANSCSAVVVPISSKESWESLSKPILALFALPLAEHVDANRARAPWSKLVDQFSIVKAAVDAILDVPPQGD